MADLHADGAEGRKRQQVWIIAVCQKGIIICLLIQFLVPIGVFVLVALDAALPLDGVRAFQLLRDIAQILALVLLAAILVAMVFASVLSVKVYSTAMGISLAILTLVPCLGLFVLLVVNGRATFILRQNGHKVGLLSARLSDFKYSLRLDPASPHPNPLPEGEGGTLREFS